MNSKRLISAAAFLTIFAASTADASLTISSRPTRDVTCSAGTCRATSNIAFLNVDDLASMLAAGDIAVVSDSVSHDILVNDVLTWTSASRLTLDSHFSIFFNSSIFVAGPGSLTIATNQQARTADYGFYKKARIEFWHLKSGLSINGVSYVLEDSLSALADDMHTTPAGDFALARSISARGSTYTSSPIPSFFGTLQGLGNTIEGLSIDAGSNLHVGLFGALNGQALVRDIGLPNVNISGSGEKGIGALAGVLYTSTVKHAYATGQVSGGDFAMVGGLIGESHYGSVARSYTDVAVSAGNSARAGGLVGYFYGATNLLIDTCYAQGSVLGGANTNAGGLAGLNSGLISNSYATATVTAGAGARIGGLVGRNIDTKDSKPTFADVYATGALSGGFGAVVGGLVGHDVSDSNLQDSYWDLETSGVSDPHRGAGNVTDDEGITGLTTAQFKSGLPSGFSSLYWAQKAKRNGGYPYLFALP